MRRSKINGAGGGGYQDQHRSKSHLLIELPLNWRLFQDFLVLESFRHTHKHIQTYWHTSHKRSRMQQESPHHSSQIECFQSSVCAVCWILYYCFFIFDFFAQIRVNILFKLCVKYQISMFQPSFFNSYWQAKRLCVSRLCFCFCLLSTLPIRFIEVENEPELSLSHGLYYALRHICSHNAIPFPIVCAALRQFLKAIKLLMVARASCHIRRICCLFSMALLSKNK